MQMPYNKYFFLHKSNFYNIDSDSDFSDHKSCGIKYVVINVQMHGAQMHCSAEKQKQGSVATNFRRSVSFNYRC